MKLLLQHGANINAKSTVETGNRWEETPLYIAISSKQVEAVELLLQQGANTTIKDQTGATPLHLAVHKGWPDIVRLLLQYGVDIKMTNKKGLTPLELAQQELAEVYNGNGKEGRQAILEMLVLCVKNNY